MVKKFDPAIIEAEENLLIDFQFLLQEALTTKQITLSDLAERAGLSKSRISQIMSPNANPTVKTLARLFHALGEHICVNREELRLRDERQFPEKWNWTVESEHTLTRSDAQLVAMLKDTAASNDNYRSRFLFIDTELEIAA